MSNEKHLRKHLSPMGAWAFAIGTSVGWGSLVVTASTYLAQAGPAGSALGLVLGALIMIVIALNYSYLMQSYPEAGGAYVYAREAFGYDFGFLAAWFLSMTYFAILWANATSLPLFARILLGGIFRVGKLYTIFNYDVYLGEALLSVCGLLLFGYVCANHSRLADKLQIGLACLFSAGIVVCFLAALVSKHQPMQPSFIPDASALSQIIKIAVISPWAFIGFESISHTTEEFDFDRSKIRRVMLIAVVSTLALYIFVTLLSVTAYPPQYANWIEYINDLDNLSGIEALPAFYAANRYLGGFGVTALMLSLLALVITSLIGNTTALSRLMYAMAKDKILPEKFTHLNDQDVPSKSVWLVVGISCFIPLVGRTAIGWIVDVTTIGATLIYCLVSAAASRLGKDTDDRRGMILGCVGLVIMIAFGVYILLPNLIARGSLVKETYFLFIIWSVLGFLFFRSILQRDKAQRFGAAFIVWVVLLALVLFIALIWMRQSMIETNDRLMDNIQGYYAQQQDMDGTRQLDEHFIEDELTKSQDEDTQTMLMAVGMFAFALVIMLTNHSYMNKRSKENEMLANIDPMTGVKSKHAYMVSEKGYDLAITEGRANPFAVMVGDVNGLKKINDALGHKAGDEYIREACRMVCEIFDHSPVYRVGGDEFVVILTGRDYAVRKDLMRVMHDRSVLHINEGGAVISGGLSEYRPEEDKSFHDVFSRADAQMYEEKMLLKGLGAVTRDGSEEEAQAKVEEPAILSIRRQVLVVEDEIVNQQMLGGALQNDYEVLYASDGLEALEIIRENRDYLAVVLLDLNMPRMDGIELLKTIKQDQSLTGISVIVLTSNQNAEVECLKLGAVDFIRKPYPTWEIIQARVNKCVELSENRNIIRSTERDSLTNLFNIDYFLRYVNMYDQHYQDMAMDAIVVDVNHFHMINERYGKQYGDTLLKRIGENVRKVARQIGGVGCRRGADIFLIYCPHREDYVELLDRLSADLDDDTTSGRVRLRMGVYAQVDKSYEIETRFDYAKIASNTVRTGFTKGVGIYDDEMHEKEIFRSRLLEDFRPALESGQFIVHFQPKYDIRQEKPVLSSAEALVRWKHPEYGMLKPNTFIPLLEENGLILQLDQYVWRRSAARIQRWKERFGYALPVSVNVSRVDMLTPNLKNIFADILKEYDLSSKDLVLEITESAYAGDSEQIISTARELRGLGMGFRIEMDDFGAGYSSLAMLAKLPIDVLKLDISFVHNAFGQNRDVRMIELIIDIADYLNVPVVAEGVETEEQYLTLKAMGCDYVQGFYFSEALSPEDFEALLTKSKPQPGDAKAAIRKNWLDITDGMAGRYENIFYIDVNTSFYLEFVAMEDGRLQLRLGGMDFVSDVDKKLLDGVKPEDAQHLRAALTNANLVKWANTDEQTVVTYQKDIGGELKTYAIQTLRTRESDAQHIVIGVKRQ